MHRLVYVAVATVLTIVGAFPAHAASLPRPAAPAVAPAQPPFAATSRATATAPSTSAGINANTGRPLTGSAHHLGATASRTDVLSVRGAGPYRIGVSLDRLTAAGLIDWSVASCDGVVAAGATGAWAGVVLLAFRHGRLVEVSTATAPPHSPAGAGVGMSFTELETIYGPRGDLIRNDAGTTTAYLVRVGSRVELFTGHPIRPGVGAFQVGTASFVERRFRQGSTC